MTPTRALIEAAETANQILNNAGNSNYYSEAVIEAMSVLQSAISSAKAAEEGVETKYRVEYFDGTQWNPWTGHDNEIEAKTAMESIAKGQPKFTYRITQIDTRTTVISVREKDGL
jgi:hypothetical protein